MATSEAKPQGDTRRARTDARLSEVVNDHLQRYGYSGLTIERVSSESGVAKTTIYRRWASKADMVFDLTIQRNEKAALAIDTGSLEGDIRAISEHTVLTVMESPGCEILPGLLADVAADTELSERMCDGFVTPAREIIETMFARASARGELDSQVDVEEFHSTLLGVPYAWFHILGCTDTDRIVDHLSAHLLHLVSK